MFKLCCIFFVVTAIAVGDIEYSDYFDEVFTSPSSNDLTDLELLESLRTTPSPDPDDSVSMLPSTTTPPPLLSTETELSQIVTNTTESKY
jgi:hypothetical protein